MCACVRARARARVCVRVCVHVGMCKGISFSLWRNSVHNIRRWEVRGDRRHKVRGDKKWHKEVRVTRWHKELRGQRLHKEMRVDVRWEMAQKGELSRWRQLCLGNGITNSSYPALHRPSPTTLISIYNKARTLFWHLYTKYQYNCTRIQTHIYVRHFAAGSLLAGSALTVTFIMKSVTGRVKGGITQYSVWRHRARSLDTVHSSLRQRPPLQQFPDVQHDNTTGGVEQ